MPPLPLHSNIGNVNCEDSYNLGLRFEKYFNYYNADFTKTSTEKHQFIGKFIKTHSIKNNNAQIQNLCKHLGGITLKYKTTTSLVTGMGQDHPLENGLLFHPTWGCPYISGASLKGALRAYFDNWLNGNKNEKEATIQRIFGSDDTNSPASGNYQFFDALPSDNIKLCKEIMTPHYGDWYAQGGKINDPIKKHANKIPGDWHDPSPIQFLAVAKGTKFQFTIAPSPICKLDNKQKEDDLELLKEALKNQLTHFGLGAKTATGFGYFEKVPLSDEEQAQIDKEKKERDKQRLLSQLLEWQKILIEQKEATIDDEPAFFIKNPNQLLKKINEYSSIENDIIIYLKANLISLVHKYKRVNQMSSYNAAKKKLKENY